MISHLSIAFGIDGYSLICYFGQFGYYNDYFCQVCFFEEVFLLMPRVTPCFHDFMQIYLYHVRKVEHLVISKNRSNQGQRCRSWDKVKCLHHQFLIAFGLSVRLNRYEDGIRCDSI